jgi:hypothetical protein
LSVRLVGITGFLDFLEQTETETVFALVSDGEVREDEVKGRLRSIQVDHSRNGTSSQDSGSVLLRVTAGASHRAGLLEGSKHHIVGMHGLSDVLVETITFALFDGQLNDRRRIHGPTVSLGFDTLTTSSRALRLLENIKLIAQSATLDGGPGHDRCGLIVNFDDIVIELTSLVSVHLG